MELGSGYTQLVLSIRRVQVRVRLHRVAAPGVSLSPDAGCGIEGRAGETADGGGEDCAAVETEESTDHLYDVGSSITDGLVDWWESARCHSGGCVQRDARPAMGMGFGA